jgi:hypothetical protein
LRMISPPRAFSAGQDMALDPSCTSPGIKTRTARWFRKECSHPALAAHLLLWSSPQKVASMFQGVRKTCDTSTPCCASAISIPRSNSTRMRSA